MTATVDHLGELRSRMAGDVVTPADPGYDEARRVWNGSIDHRPVAIARCAGVEDVVVALDHARRNGLPLSVRAGGHSSAGLSVGDGTLVIDLAALNEVVVDPAARRARVGGGALLRDMDAACQEHGLAVPAGEVGHTGIGGLALGGGMGWLTRRAGLTVDHLLGAQVVLADGRVVRTSADELPDLFWALRGGGGNFGIVTEFEFSAVPVGPLVSFGMTFFRLDDGAAVLRLARDLLPGLPPTLGFQIICLTAPPAPFVPADVQGWTGWALVVVGTSGEQPDPDADAARDRILAAAPAPLFEFRTPMPFTALQQMFDEANAWGVHWYEKGCYLPGLPDRAIETLAEHARRKVSPLSLVHLYTLDGAYCEVPDDATAFGGDRTPRLGAFVVGASPDAAGLPTETAWVRDLHAGLLPHAIGGGVYVNSMMADDAPRTRATYGDKYDRLAAIKAVYDPDNVFARNANIPPMR